MNVPARVWLLGFLLFSAVPAPLFAHPLGNFTMNHLAIVRASHGILHVRYIVDIAEIPSFQIMHANKSDGNWRSADFVQWAIVEKSIVLDNFVVSVDDKPLQVSNTESPRAHARPGAGGLPTLYWSDDFTYALPDKPTKVEIADSVYAGRAVGWRDIAIGSHTDPTHELTAYPSALIGSPRRIDRASFESDPLGALNGVSLTESDDVPTGSTSIVRSNALSDLFSSSNHAPLFIAFTILMAFGLGALHALEPGHGKALLAFTLVGSRATVKQAGVLALSLTFAHTIGVLILGLVLFFAADFVSESIYPWITLVSGVAIAIIGGRNLARYFNPAHHAHHHEHATDHHHGNEDEHGHSHAIPGSGPIDFRGAVVAAMSGGIAPCPAAIVVMLAALRLHRVGYGVLLIVIFSLGLASVLTGLGIAVVHGSAIISRSRRFERLVAAGPMLSAIVISVVGAVMIGQGMVAQNIHVGVWLVAALTLLAIFAYAIIPFHSHHHGVETA